MTDIYGIVKGIESNQRIVRFENSYRTITTREIERLRKREVNRKPKFTAKKKKRKK